MSTVEPGISQSNGFFRSALICVNPRLIFFRNTRHGYGRSIQPQSREEREVRLENFDEMQVILERLGYKVTFRYDKHRTEYAIAGADGVATIDETPVGTFMELEGPPEWIDNTAASLGFLESDYITESYAALYSGSTERRG